MALILDIECYSNFFLVCFMDLDTGKVGSFQMHEGKPLNVSKIAHLMRSHTTVGFNSSQYDLPMIAAALENRSCEELKKVSDAIITSNLPSWRVLQDLGVNVPDAWDHIDIIEVLPGQASLKVYAGRIGYPKLQDLPIEPSAIITPDQRDLLKQYCINDVRVTAELYRMMGKQIALRVDMGLQYSVDLRSKSDAQIAETVLKSEIEGVSGKTLRPTRPDPPEHPPPASSPRPTEGCLADCGCYAPHLPEIVAPRSTVGSTRPAHLAQRPPQRGAG